MSHFREKVATLNSFKLHNERMGQVCNKKLSCRNYCKTRIFVCLYIATVQK